jgi:hypothetical protein
MLGLWLFPFLSIPGRDKLTISSVPLRKSMLTQPNIFRFIQPPGKNYSLTVRKGTKSDEEIFVSSWNGKQLN